MNATTTDVVIHTRGLRKTFRDRGRRVVAVDDLDLVVERGGVHGFLGPNGSGKTTTIRLLLGLARPDSGSIELLGAALPDGLPEALTRVGALVDAPHFAPNLSGRRNLLLLARAGRIPAARVDEVLEQVELRDRARTRYASYSLGMRQRLGLAAAVLKDPALLILDEPANGLDPAGIRDMRDTIRRLGETGTTVLLSSHVLAEVQQVCSSVSIIADGRLLTTGRVADLLGESVARTRVRVSDPDAAAEHLRAAGHDVRRDGDLLVVQGHERPEGITELLAGHGLFVSELSSIRPTLESYFLQLTGHPPRGGPAHADRPDPLPPAEPADPANVGDMEGGA